MTTPRDKHSEHLEILDEDENIIGTAPRDEIHSKGLLHQEIHVWLYTPDGKIIFQKRAMTKDTAPGLLDASAGGHIDLECSHQDAAVQELAEETGITASIDQLRYIDKVRYMSHIAEHKQTNYTVCHVYAYCYEGDFSDLVVEKKKSDGFETYSLEELQNLSDKDKEKFIPMLLNAQTMEVYRKIFE